MPYSKPRHASSDNGLFTTCEKHQGQRYHLVSNQDLPSSEALSAENLYQRIGFGFTSFHSGFHLSIAGLLASENRKQSNH